MNGKYLLDTNIIIDLFAKVDSVHKKLKDAEEVFIPAIVLGELYFGAMKSKKVESNVKRIDDFATANAILVCDATVAKEYGTIKNKLKEKGCPIPENDIWIAAMAIRNSLTLVSRDDHFKHIETIQWEVW